MSGSREKHISKDKKGVMNKESGGGNSQACASCKHQRKKCSENCELAPYFPASRYREFQNAHKLFGVSNIQKIINSVEPHQRQAAAESILIEGNIRYLDPVHGSLGVVRNLQAQIEAQQKELEALNQQLAFLRERERQQQQQLQLQYCVESSSAEMPPPPSMFHYEAEAFNISQAPTLPDIGDMKIGQHMINYQSTVEESADGQPFDFEDFDPLLDPYQTGQAPISSYEPENSKGASGKQPVQSTGDEDAERANISSLKGKRHMG